MCPVVLLVISANPETRLPLNPESAKQSAMSSKLRGWQKPGCRSTVGRQSTSLSFLNDWKFERIINTVKKWCRSRGQQHVTSRFTSSASVLHHCSEPPPPHSPTTVPTRP